MSFMSLMISELYDALKEAGATEDKARAAASAVAQREDRFDKIEIKLTIMEGKIDLLKWMIGFNLAFSMAVVWKVFT